MSSEMLTATVHLDMKNTDVFKSISDLLKDVTHDPRIDEEVKQEYKSKLVDIITDCGNCI